MKQCSPEKDVQKPHNYRYYVYQQGPSGTRVKRGGKSGRRGGRGGGKRVPGLAAVDMERVARLQQARKDDVQVSVDFMTITLKI